MGTPMPLIDTAPGSLTPAEARAAFRAGRTMPTAGIADGHTQANLIVLPREYADDMREFARRNPKPCPILEITAPGTWRSALARDADLRTDVPGYRVWEHGQAVADVLDVVDLWHADLVSFLIGCSFSFETLLRDAGVPIRHIEQGRNVPMYVTDRPCEPAGALHGPLVVSMRPVPAALVETAVTVTARMPRVHGDPVHVGDPAALGIRDLAHPDFGDAVDIQPGDVPVFWACGVTSQQAVLESGPDFAITHIPGHMFITDARDVDYRTA